jgi:glycosyltransferase involved in cell wall biosynthesis
VSTDGGPRTRVLHLITRLIVGGAQENTLASVARVAPDRYESHLWSGPQTGTEGSLFDEARRQDISVRVVPGLIREIRPIQDLLAVWRLARLMRRERFDIVHTHTSKAGIVGRIAARIAGAPIVIQTAHGWGFHDHLPRWRKAAYVLLERLTARWTDCLVSVSEETTRFGLQYGIGSKERYRLIRSGIPFEGFSPDSDRGARMREEIGLEPDALVIGSVGRLTDQKNPIDFVRLGIELAPRFDRLRLLYVGDGPLRFDVEAMARERGIADRLKITGVRREVPDLLRAMDLFVLTSLWEGLPRVVLQALATGVPVLAYDTAGTKEVVQDGRNGHLVAPGDLGALARHCADLLGDENRRRTMGEHAREELEEDFSESGMILRLEQLYDELVQRKLR